ncbi:hypothetical protein [Cupriavidus taiwanensis]|uniref:hypothetical protein n=1 Tax=Cupriavidus taiwanensis TaxID=164546 RepID=UPI0039C2011A
MAWVELHEDAKNDIRELIRTQPELAKKLVALIQQLNLDPALRARLLEHNYGDDAVDVINVKKWLRLFKARKDLWRLKPLNLGPVGLGYRVFYAYQYKERCFHVLAIVQRSSIDYDLPTHPLAVRIQRAYSSLG